MSNNPKNTTIQKVIRIGSSAGVTLPAKDLKRLGIKPGDEIKLNYSLAGRVPDSDKLELVEITQKLIKRHKQALKNLSQR